MDLRDVELLQITPSSIAEDADIQALSAAIDPELRAVSDAILEAVILPRITQQPEAVLDALAWGFGLLSVDGWADADLARKRAYMQDVFGVYLRRGTVWAVRRALSIVHDADAILTEWWQESPPGDPFSYRVALEVGPSGITAQTIARVRQMLLYYAPKRAYIAELSTVTVAPAPMIAPAVLVSGTDTTIEEYIP